MAEALKIKVTIAGRIYPIRVKSEQEEEGVRSAAQKINNLVTKFEKNYAVSDKQDVLAMCALQFASIHDIGNLEKNANTKEAQKKINEINELIKANL